jgi:hypothetical protein
LPDLIRQSIIFAKKIDARVKPVHDEENDAAAGDPSPALS